MRVDTIKGDEKKIRNSVLTFIVTVTIHITVRGATETNVLVTASQGVAAGESRARGSPAIC